MDVQDEQAGGEIKRLQRCINDLVSLLALPAIWSGGDISQVLDTLLNTLMRMLRLDLVCVRLNLPVVEAPIEIVRVSQSLGPMPSAHEICEALNDSLGDSSRRWPPLLRNVMGDRDVSMVPLPLGLQGELGMIVAAAQRSDFPQQTEALLLSVATSQACIGLQEARLLSQQKRIADELDQRVAQRTAELAAANAELQLQVGLLQTLPVSAWTLKPDGTPDFVNRVWLEYSGQSLDFVRSRPDAWMAAVHPEDRETASTAFWEGVRSGQGFAFETRSLRAQDGTYRWHLQQAVVLHDAEGKVLKFVGTTTDIDDQKRAEEELRASETNLRQILDNIPGFVCTLSPAGQVEFPNQRMVEYFGKTLDEINSWSTNDLVHPDDRPRVIAEVTRSFTTGTLYDGELRYRRADGVYRWFQVRILPERDADGRITRWYGLITDIEDRKRAEEALRESDYESRLIVDCIPGMVAVVSASGEVVWLGRQILDYYEKSLEEINDQWTTGEMIHPEDRPGLIQAFAQSLASGDPIELELRARRFDGVYRWFDLRGRPLRARQGRIVRWLFLQIDIDDRKRAEEALRASENNFRQIVDNIPGLVATLSPSGEIELVNQQYLEYFGKSLDEIKSWRVNDVLHPDDLHRMEASFTRAMTTGTALIEEFRYRRADGVFRWFHARVFPMMDQDGSIGRWFVLATDIDDRKCAENALNELRSELAHMARVTSLGALTASIAHEVSQPLAGIVTNASTCLRTLSADPPNIDVAREAARRAIRDGNRASEVITRLRTLFSKKQIEVEPLDLNEATREVVALLSGELEKNSINLKHEFSERLPAVHGDRVQLQQVILNLLRNASDAMSGIKDRPRQMVLRTELEGEHVRLSVQDSGVGFTPEVAEQMFESFYTTKSDGMGVGLSVSRSIIEANHGRLWATANDGPGATFAFSIPCEPGS